MTRQPLIRIPLNDKQTRYKVTYHGDPCEATSVAGRNQQVNLLQALLDQPQLLYTGTVLFDTMRVYHDGSRWVVELEGVE